MKPLHKQVLIKPDVFPDKIGTIWMPETSKWERMNFGDVVSIGDEHREVEVGDRVVFPKTHGMEFEYQGEKYLVLEEDEVLCRVE